MPQPLGGLSTQGREKSGLEPPGENAEVPQDCRVKALEERGPFPALAGLTPGLTQIAEPGTVSGTGPRVPLGQQIPLGCCAMNFGEGFCSLLGQGWDTEEFFAPCLISALLAEGQVEAERFWEGKQQPGTHGSGSRVSFFFFSN